MDPYQSRKNFVIYGFIEHIDYEAINQKGLTAQGNETEYIDHQITIEMGKEIAMLQSSENETRKDFSKKERIEYAKRLRVIEKIKAKDRMSLGGQGKESFPTLQTRDIVADKLNVGSGRQLEKEEYIVENQTSLSPVDFTDWDEGKLSTNKKVNQAKFGFNI